MPVLLSCTAVVPFRTTVSVALWLPEAGPTRATTAGLDVSGASTGVTVCVTFTPGLLYAVDANFYLPQAKVRIHLLHCVKIGIKVLSLYFAQKYKRILHSMSVPKYNLYEIISSRTC